MTKMTEIKVTLFFDWDDEGSEFHCGSIKGAKKFVENKVARGDVKAYAIEVIDWMPVDRKDPDGQLYGGMVYHEFQEVQK